MKYAKGTLKATAESRIKEWQNYSAQLLVKAQSDYEAKLEEWIAVEKPKALERLADATKSLKANKPVSPIHFRYGDFKLQQPPEPPSKPGHTCNGITDQLRGLIDMLDTLADDEISATALNMAGFKDMKQLLKVPC